MLLIPVSWKQYILSFHTLSAFTEPLLPSKSSILAIVTVVQLSTIDADCFCKDHIIDAGKLLSA